MAKFELSIYGTDDEKIKTYEADRVRWGVLLKAVDLSEHIAEKSPVEQVKTIGNILKLVFTDLTDEDLELADYNDVMNTFFQITKSIKSIKVDDSKNV